MPAKATFTVNLSWLTPASWADAVGTSAAELLVAACANGSGHSEEAKLAS